MHEVSAVWQQIYEQPDHRKETAATVNGVEYYEGRILNTAPSLSGKLFDAPSVGNARSRTLTLNLMPYDGPQGYISPLSEIRLFVRLKSADGQSVSEWIPKGVFYADEIKRDSDTGATRITAFDAIMKMERQYGNAVCRITFDDGLGGIQRFIRHIGDAMPVPDTPTHEGERFSAWYPNPADTQTVVRDMLFTAEWARKFTVTFDSGSGTPQTFSVFSGDATPTPTTPTKEGYTFTGWTPTPAATVTADATYTAQWEKVTRGIAITAYPAKMTYGVGETLNYAGLTVTMTYSNGTTQDVTADCGFSPIPGTRVTEAGEITVTVYYGYETPQTFSVTAETIGGDWWAIRGDGTLDVYCQGDIPDYDLTAYGALLYYSGGYTYGGGGYYITNAPWSDYAHKIVSSIYRPYDNGYHGDYFPGTDDYADYTGFILERPAIISSISIRDGVTGIGQYAFAYMELQSSLVIPDSVTEIGYGAFEGVKGLTSVVIPDSVTEIGPEAFSCTGLTSVVIPGSVDTVDGFRGIPSLTSVVIKEGATEIAGYAFGNNPNLASVVIPRSVKYIGYRAFTSSYDGHHDYSSNYALKSVTISRDCVLDYSVFPTNCVINYYED